MTSALFSIAQGLDAPTRVALITKP